MNLAERIKAAQTALVEKKDELVIATKALEANPDDDSLLAQVTELTGQVEKATTSIDALLKAEAALASRAQAQAEAPAVISHRQKSQDEDGVIWKMAAAKVLAHATKTPLNQVVEKHYSGNKALPAVMDYITKSQIDPAMTSVAGWAAELVQSDVQGFLDTLKTTSVAAALAARSQQLNFNGYNSITVPRRNANAAGSGRTSWVGEAGAIPLVGFNFGSAVINRFKLAAISTFSAEIAERSTPQIESILRSALTEDYSEVLDNAFLSASAAVAGVRPAGLLNNVTVGTGATGGGQDAVSGDLKAMMSKLLATRGGVRPVLVINDIDRLSLSFMTSPLGDAVYAAELATGRLAGVEVVSSANVPKGTAILIDAAALVTAFDGPMFDVSDVATVVESNADGTAPTMAGAGPGNGGAIGTAGQVPVDGGISVGGSTGASTTGYQARSLWQTYSIGLRMICPTSFTMLRPGSVQAVNTITW
jgi:HK97 family phage major capsid protein